MAGWGDTWLSPSVIERRFSIPVIFDDHAHVSSLRDDLPTVLSRFGGTTPKTSRKDFVIENIQSIIFGNAMNERNKYYPSYASIPPYEALSYVWGSGLAQTPIYINDRPIVIKPNLDAALQSLRLPTQARLLWVDALCIDQSNADERSRQVGYMRLVYKHATQVIVWLGSWTSGAEMAFELAERLAHMRDSCGADKDTLQKAVVELAIGAPEAFHHLDQLFDRPYFIRNWCIQEVVASK
ncbi:hypothetical protein PABG_01185 [Paracoccidioides brasiliensis Pb03]|nr:hypothetical protein PABG_01185 [Paracoccidioides brasiliensis Pb03]